MSTLNYSRKPKPKGKRKFRKCLKCGAQFSSHGIGNRICYKCSQVNMGASPFEDGYAVVELPR